MGSKAGLESGHTGTQPVLLPLPLSGSPPLVGKTLALVLGEQLSCQRWRYGETGATGQGEDPPGCSGTPRGRQGGGQGLTPLFHSFIRRPHLALITLW